MLPSQLSGGRPFAMEDARRDFILRLFISIVGLVIALKIAG
jgi:hypothetical protein